MANDNLALWRKLENASSKDAVKTLNLVFGKEGTDWGWNVTEESVLKLDKERLLTLIVTPWYKMNGKTYYLSTVPHIGLIKDGDVFDDIRTKTIQKAILFSFSFLGLAANELNQKWLNAH